PIDISCHTAGPAIAARASHGLRGIVGFALGAADRRDVAAVASETAGCAWTLGVDTGPAGCAGLAHIAHLTIPEARSVGGLPGASILFRSASPCGVKPRARWLAVFGWQL